MIANAHAHGRYTTLEDSEINRATLQFEIAHFIVCDATGTQLEPHFASLAAARAFINALLGLKDQVQHVWSDFSFRPP